MRIPLKQIAGSGATDGQVITWDNTAGAYVAGDSNLAGGLTNTNREMVALGVTGDGGKASNTALAATVTAWVEIQVNGVGVEIGDGVKTKACYISSDGDVARAYGALTAGDFLYWNASIAGYPLTTTDRIDIIFDNEGAGGGSGGGGDIPDASLTVSGKVNLVDQVLGNGVKTFSSAVAMSSAPGAEVAGSGEVRLRSNTGILEFSSNGGLYTSITNASVVRVPFYTYDGTESIVVPDESYTSPIYLVGISPSGSYDMTAETFITGTDTGGWGTLMLIRNLSGIYSLNFTPSTGILEDLILTSPTLLLPPYESFWLSLDQGYKWREISRSFPLDRATRWVDDTVDHLEYYDGADNTWKNA